MIKIYSKNGSVVNVREFPDVSTKVIDQIKGSESRVLIEWSQMYNGYRWAKVNVNGKFGYIREDVVKYVNESDSGLMLSKYMSEKAFIRSDKASMLKIDNSFANDTHRNNAIRISKNIYDPVCDHFGKTYFVSSGYRSPKVNRAVGGSSTSAHPNGNAIDLDSNVRGENTKCFEFIRKNLEFDQLIWEFGNNENPDWVHVGLSNSGKNRMQVLRAVSKKNGTVYLPY